MKFRRPTDLCIVSFISGLAVLGFSRRPVLLGVLNFIHRSTTWATFGDAISFVLVGFAALFLLLAVYSAIVSLSFSGLWQQAGAAINDASAGSKGVWESFADYTGQLGFAAVWAVLALGIGTCVRGYFLSQPMRGDESFTFLTYVNNGLSSLFNYTEINDHVLSNILIKVSTLIFGGSPPAIRFPAFLAGIATILLVFIFARALDPGKNVGIFAALGTAVFPYLILFSTNARGYAVITLLTLTIALFGLRFVQRPSRKRAVALALLSSLGMFTIPVMVVPLAGICLWMLALLLINKVPLKTIFFEFLMPYGIFCGVFTFVFYTPVILASNGIGPIVANKFVKPQTWSVFMANVWPQTQSSVGQLFRDIPLVVLVLAGLLFLAAIYRSARTHNWAVLLLLPLVLFGAAVPMVIQRQIPYARTWCFIIPFMMLVVDFGLNAILERIPGRGQAWLNAAVILLGLAYAVNLMARNVITGYPDTSGFPEAPIAVQYLKPIFKPNDAVRITSTANWSIAYYFWYYKMPQPTAKAGQTDGRIFYIVKKSRAGNTDNLQTSAFVQLLDIGDMALYQRVGK